MSLPDAPAAAVDPGLTRRWRRLIDEIIWFPWRGTLLTLRERFREDHLALTASSLTFTTTIAMVPFFTVALALFTAFPMFAKFQDVLQKWLIESLIPDNIARQVLGYLTQFAGKASRLGAAGLIVLLSTALALTFTIDRTLNAIWRVRRPRPFGQRVLFYWAAITFGPLLLGVSLTLTSYALTASRGVVGVLPGGVPLLLDLIQFLLMALGMTSLYRYVPNTAVRWSHAWAGGLFVAAGLELAKKLLTVYLAKVPTYSAVYGAFATVPILLVWIYLAWVIVLMGAVIAAYLPALQSRTPHRPRLPGVAFQLALETLQLLKAARREPQRGLTAEQLAARLRADPPQLDRVLATLRDLDWIGQLDEETPGAPQRQVLLAEPATTPLAPLVQALLLPRQPATEALWQNSRWATARLDQALSNQ
ncbi:MAG: YihY family inner membrane protein [Rhodoferax sp.]|nr:YihY family inner membrane protein [Rhodoferax sp.]